MNTETSGKFFEDEASEGHTISRSRKEQSIVLAIETNLARGHIAAARGSGIVANLPRLDHVVAAARWGRQEGNEHTVR